MGNHEHHGTVEVRVHEVDIRDENIAPEITGFVCGTGGV
jgi:hypothetical protein